VNSTLCLLSWDFPTGHPAARAWLKNCCWQPVSTAVACHKEDPHTPLVLLCGKPPAAPKKTLLSVLSVGIQQHIGAMCPVTLPSHILKCQKPGQRQATVTSGHLFPACANQGEAERYHRRQQSSLQRGADSSATKQPRRPTASQKPRAALRPMASHWEEQSQHPLWLLWLQELCRCGRVHGISAAMGKAPLTEPGAGAREQGPALHGASAEVDERREKESSFLLRGTPCNPRKG